MLVEVSFVQNDTSVRWDVIYYFYRIRRSSVMLKLEFDEQQIKEVIDKIVDLQYDLLCSSYRYLKKGGRLIYSTCSLNPFENEKVCQRFLKEHKSAKIVPIFEDIEKYESDSMVSLMPHINGTDGFFITAFCKTE